MLSLFLFHIIITGVCLCAGFLFYEAIPKSKAENNASRPVIAYLISGLICLTIFFQIIVLFVPVNIISQSISMLFFLLLLVFRRSAFRKFIQHISTETRSQSLLLFVTAGSIWILLLLLNAGKTMMDDTESYHIQMVKWIKEYGTVPGIVHLHERFGFNSSWFTSIAMFNPQSGNLNYYTSLNGVLSLWLSVYLLTLIVNKKKSGFLSSIAGMAVFVVCIISWPLLRGNVSTSNYDYITLLAIFILFAETLKYRSSITNFSFFTEWFIWPTYLFTVRITNFPFLFLTIFAIIFLWKQKEKNKIFISSFLCLLLVIPFLARNIILSGYPFYPSVYFDWFSVDWKANKETTLELLHFIKYYNRVSTGFLPLETTEAMSFSQWIKAWITYMFTYDKIIFIPGISGLLSGIIFIIRNKTSLSFANRLFISVICLQLVVWFLVAPDPRFIYGCLLCGVLLLFLMLPSFVNTKKKTAWPSIGLITITAVVAGFTVIKLIKSDRINLVLPERLPQPPIQTIQVDNISIHIPGKILNNWNPRCYATELPCAYSIDPKVRARGPDIKAGFKMDK